MTMFCQRTLKIARYGVAMLMICTAAASNAADAVGWYAGLAVGGTQVAAKTASGSSFGPETFGFELSGGRRVSDHFAVDFGLQRWPTSRGRAAPLIFRRVSIAPRPFSTRRRCGSTRSGSCLLDEPGKRP